MVDHHLCCWFRNRNNRRCWCSSGWLRHGCCCCCCWWYRVRSSFIVLLLLIVLILFLLLLLLLLMWMFRTVTLVADLAVTTCRLHWGIIIIVADEHGRTIRCIIIFVGILWYYFFRRHSLNNSLSLFILEWITTRKRWTHQRNLTQKSKSGLTTIFWLWLYIPKKNKN